MKQLLLLLILVISKGLSAQKADSLNRLFLNSEGEEKYKNAYFLAKYWYDQKNDSALYFLDYIINKTPENGKDTIRANALRLKGNLYIFERDYRKAERHYKAALEIYRKANHLKGIDATLNNLGIVMLRQHKHDEAIELLQESIENAQKKDDLLSVAKTYHNLGYIYELKLDNEKALEYYLKALQLKRNFSDSSSVSSTLNNIGNIYANYEEHQKAEEYYRQSLAISRYLKDSADIALRYYNLARNYRKMHKLEKSMEYFLASLEIYELLKKPEEISKVYNALGNLYALWQKNKEAILHYEKAIKYLDENEDANTLARIYNNLADINDQAGNIKQAETYYKKSQEHFHKTKLFKEYITVNINYAQFLIKQKEFEKARKLLAETIQLAKEKDNMYLMSNALISYSKLYHAKRQYRTALNILNEANKKAAQTNSFKLKQRIYLEYYKNFKKLRQYRNALSYYERYQEMGDSIFTKETLKNIAELEKQYQLKQKEKEILLLSSKNKLKELENTAQRIKIKNVTIVRNVAIGGGFLLLLLVVISFYAFLSKRRANKKLKVYNAEITEQKEEIQSQNDEIAAQLKQIEKQKNELEIQQNNIKDSINYAQYIQKSIFPSEDFFSQFFNDYFIFYRPKDIVSGDFYFGETSPDAIYLAVIDCTGHGVPGAFMSMLGYNALRSAVLEQKITNPSKILDHIDLHIKEATHSSPEIEGSGMDVILLKFDKEMHEVEVSGAKRPLIIFRDGELIEIAGTKRSVGRLSHKNQKKFTSKKWPLEPNDTLYLFTDGIVDQFGGPKTKKFKSVQFKNKLSEIQNMELSIQKNILIRTFDEWKGQNEQIDDILVLGIKI